MPVIGNVSKQSGESEEVAKGRGEEESAPTESQVQEQFIKCISAHEEQVQKLLRHSRKFIRESICGQVDVSRDEGSFLWRGAAPYPLLLVSVTNCSAHAREIKHERRGGNMRRVGGRTEYGRVGK
jgi:hypothetical protein